MPRHGHGNRHIDADHADLNAPTEFTRHVAVAGETRHAIAKLVVVDDLHSGGEVGNTHTRQYRAKNFFFVNAHVGGDLVEQRAAHPKTLVAARTGLCALEATSIHQQLGAFTHTLCDVAADAIQRGLGDDRAHFSRQVFAVQDLQGFGALDQFGHDFVGHIAHQHRHTDGHATLSSRAVGSTNQGIDHLVQIGVRHDHHVVFRATQSLHALAMVGASLVDVVGNRRGTDKADGFDIGVHQQGVHRFFVALHDVEHAIGQPRLLEQIGQHQRRCRVGRAGFQDKGVTRGDGHGEHPHGHHDRKVEWRDTSHHTQGLAQCPVVDAGGHLLGVIALEQLRNAGGEFDDVDATRHLALGIGEHLAVFGGDGVGQGVFVLVQQFQKFEHDPGTAQRRRIGPSRKSGLRSGHGLADIGRIGQGHVAGDFTGSGVGDG